MDILSLNCWIRGDDVGETFNVEISRTETVAALKEVIKNKKSVALRDVDTLRLYRLRDPLPRPYNENLSKIILSVHGESLKLAIEELSEVFPQPPPQHHMHVIVDAPSTIICWLRGSTIDASFPISIRPDADQCIMHQIKDAQPNLRNVAHHHIRLYRISGDESQLQESLSKTGDGELLKGITLLPHFLGVPVLDPLCVVAEVSGGTIDHWSETIGKGKHNDSDFSHGEKRLRSPLSCFVKEEHWNMASDDIVEFHSKIWDKGSDGYATAFVTTPVQQPQLADVKVPSQCCVMKSPPYTSGSTHLSGVFIRNEFVLAVENIVAFYKGESFADDPKEDDDEVEQSGMAQTGFPVTISNPFLAPDFPLKGRSSGVIVTGSPGIGKSLLLEFILHLRNLAGYPTIFVLDAGRADLFTTEGVFMFTPLDYDIVRSKLPPYVWVLINSNTDLIGVPRWVTSLGRFVVHAASPTRGDLRWESKTVGVSRHIMKKWTLEEALAARTLQHGRPPSETQLKTFFERYVPYAQTAYIFASRIQEFESMLVTIDSLSMEDVMKMGHDFVTLQTNPHSEVPHWLFLIQPGETRSSLSLEFTSPYMLNKLIAGLNERGSILAQVLFAEFNHT